MQNAAFFEHKGPERKPWPRGKPRTQNQTHAVRFLSARVLQRKVWESAKVSHIRVFALLTPEIPHLEMAQMLQKPVFVLPGCQPMSVNTLLCDTLGLAEGSKSQPRLGPSIKAPFGVLLPYWQAPDARSKRTTKKCTIKTYSFDLFSEVLESHSSSDLGWVVGAAAACWGGSAKDL